jgi:hypothetical protein
VPHAFDEYLVERKHIVGAQSRNDGLLTGNGPVDRREITNVALVQG